jgi:hypothetical protein
MGMGKPYKHMKERHSQSQISYAVKVNRKTEPQEKRSPRLVTTMKAEKNKTMSNISLECFKYISRADDMYFLSLS